MHEYLSWDEKNITDFSEKNIESLYEQGYVFTRKEKGCLQQTRSVRIDLSQFELSSENRRILRKIEDVEVVVSPIPFSDYSWVIGKLAKDFYDTKFGPGIFSANKVKELITDPAKSNFTTLLSYTQQEEVIGYAICYQSANILHYVYPFYDPHTATKDLGLGMMTMAIEYAKAKAKKYVYLGSAQRPNDTYKFQFAGVEWFTKANWSSDLDELKRILL